MKHKVCIITDAGIDDILAILFLSKRRDIEIKCIIAVSGNGYGVKAQSTIEHFFPQFSDETFSWGHESSTSLIPKNLIHGEYGLGGLLIPVCSKKEFSFDIFLRERLKNILCLAPLTLLSDLRYKPNIELKDYNVITMGGAIENGIGNDAYHAEYNFQVDSASANSVLNSVCYPTIVPLDVTRSITFGPELEAVLKSDFLAIFSYLKKKYLRLGQENIPLHDLTASCFLVAPDAFTLRHRHASVISDHNEYNGCLLIDQHMYSRKPSNCMIAFSAEASRIKYEIITTLKDNKTEGEITR